MSVGGRQASSPTPSILSSWRRWRTLLSASLNLCWSLSRWQETSPVESPRELKFTFYFFFFYCAPAVILHVIRPPGGRCKVGKGATGLHNTSASLSLCPFTHARKHTHPVSADASDFPRLISPHTSAGQFKSTNMELRG